MDNRKREFIRFLEEAGVLKFGDFIAKSGRKLPYFLNAGEVKTGGGSARLGEFYAEAYLEKLGKKRAALFGPAYKGIPLAVSAASALARRGLMTRFWSPASPSGKRIPGVTVRKPSPQAAWTAAASRGEHITPSSPAVRAFNA